MITSKVPIYNMASGKIKRQKVVSYPTSVYGLNFLKIENGDTVAVRIAGTLTQTLTANTKYIMFPSRSFPTQMVYGSNGQWFSASVENGQLNLLAINSSVASGTYFEATFTTNYID